MSAGRVEEKTRRHLDTSTPHPRNLTARNGEDGQTLNRVVAVVVVVVCVAVGCFRLSVGVSSGCLHRAEVRTAPGFRSAVGVSVSIGRR